MKTEIVNAYIENLRNHPNLIEYMYMFDSNEKPKKESIKVIEEYIDKNAIEKMFIDLESFLLQKANLTFHETRMSKTDNLLSLEYNGMNFSTTLAPVKLLPVVCLTYNAEDIKIFIELAVSPNRINEKNKFKDYFISRLNINLNSNDLQNSLIENVLHKMIQNTFKNHEDIFISKLWLFYDSINLISTLIDIEESYPKDYSFLFNALGNRQSNGMLTISPEDFLKEITKHEDFVNLLCDDNNLKNNLKSIKSNIYNITHSKPKKTNGNKNA